jgi:hypothetical protein
MLRTSVYLGAFIKNEISGLNYAPLFQWKPFVPTEYNFPLLYAELKSAAKTINIQAVWRHVCALLLF